MAKVNATTDETSLLITDDVTEIVVIIDRSGSMGSVIDDAIGGFNGFLARQQAEDSAPAWFTLIQFNDRCETVFSGIDIRSAVPLDRRTYVPSGNTALLDAVGKGINDVLQRTEGHTGKVLFAILTDGHENSSRLYTRSEIQSMVEARQEAGWEFVYLGVGLEQFDAEAVGAGIGIRADKVATYVKNKEGVDLASTQMDNAVVEYRKTGKLDRDRWKKGRK
jgi:hypothetical protein